MKTLITITGASGAGKDTLMNTLVALSGGEIPVATPLTKMFKELTIKRPIRIKPMVSHTTRPMRDGEVADKSYHFVTKEEFMKTAMVELIEYAGNMYGLSEAEINSIEDGEFGIVVVEPNGKQAIERYISERDDFKLISVFLVIDETTSRNRMVGRGDKWSSIMARINQQRERKEYFPKQPYSVITRSFDIEDFTSNVLLLLNRICEE